MTSHELHIFGKRLKPLAIRLYNSNRDMPSFARIDIGKNTRFAFMSASNDFTRGTIFELIHYDNIKSLTLLFICLLVVLIYELGFKGIQSIINQIFNF